MKKFDRLRKKFPAPLSIWLAILSAILLVLAFPGFEIWLFAWFALVPLFFAINKEKNSTFASFILGWIFGICFFFGSCWWLTYAPITYAKFPILLAYFLLFCATLVVGFFPAVFAGLFSILLKRYGNYAIFSAPFLWTAIEFLRFWIIGNNWNEIAYSQVFANNLIQSAKFGGIYLLGFQIVAFNSAIFLIFLSLFSSFAAFSEKEISRRNSYICSVVFILLFSLPFVTFKTSTQNTETYNKTTVIAVQPNVPMSGLTEESWSKLRKRHIELAENSVSKSREQNPSNQEQTTVIFPESPMNFMYESDEEFQNFVGDFARKNNVSVLFNAAEPDAENNMFFNSAVMVNADGKKIAQYDKIYLVPFGESVPAPLQNFMPALVGSFSYGKEYDLLPFGDARGGVMICFESHFPNLSREYVRNGADVLIEMTNDGYLGNTPVLRQHLANAVFRAVETNRPVLRVTNVGITAYINERGEISDAADVYTEATRTWTISKSNGEQTFYVRFGDWFAWFCIFVSLVLLIFAILKRKSV
ncbi:MAG: apolipoprotein N-acyltransferase [Pyrinomonadaceae bacterium]